MSIDWDKHIRSVVDLGATSYEQRLNRTILKAGAIALFLIVLWRFLK